jgi:BlaI family transcriptional regulator, penicillinase repressor
MADMVPTARELEALKFLWDRGEPATVRDIYQALMPADKELAYTTVLSLLQTMEQKGLVGRELVGKAHHYFPRVRKDATFRSLAGSFLERVFDGAVDQYLVRALESRPPSVQELEELEKMIAQAKRRARQRDKRGDQP